MVTITIKNCLKTDSISFFGSYTKNGITYGLNSNRIINMMTPGDDRTVRVKAKKEDTILIGDSDYYVGCIYIKIYHNNDNTLCYRQTFRNLPKNAKLTFYWLRPGNFGHDVVNWFINPDIENSWFFGGKDEIINSHRVTCGNIPSLDFIKGCKFKESLDYNFWVFIRNHVNSRIYCEQHER